MMDFRSPTMLDFTNKAKNRPPPTFSLDKRDQVRRSQMRKREWRAVIMLPVAIVAVAFFIQFLVEMRNDLGAIGRNTPLTGEVRLDPMPQPTLDGAKPLPSAEELAQADQLPNPSSVGGIGAANLAWARARLAKDAADPPMPQRLMAHDLMLVEPRPGIPALVSGRLEAIADAPIAGSDEHYQRLLIGLDEGQFAEVLAPPAAKDLVVGQEVQVVGRYLGRDDLPGPGGKPVSLPALAARAALPAERQADEIREVREWNSGAPLVMPQNLFEEVDDEHALVETRPYYYLLGQVKLDLTTPGAYDKPVDLNLRGNDVHQDPGQFRDSPVTVHGMVYRAWEDAEVAQDKPFGVDRAMRVLIYRTDYGPITETIDGQEVTRNRPVQRLFELSITGSQPLPQKDDTIQVAGRFLKFHAIPVKADDLRDRAHHVDRQSPNVYTYFVVANAYAVLPPPSMYDLKWLQYAIISIVIVGVTMFWWLSRRERVAAEVVQGQIKSLRKQRSALVGKAGEKPVEAKPETPPPGDPPPAPPTTDPPPPPPAA
jgi:hypothetical protein